MRGLRRSRTIPGQVSLSATKVCLETRTLHQPLGLSPRWSQPMVGRRLQAWAEGHQPRCSHEKPHHSLREIQDQPMGRKKPEARALATTVRLERDGLRYRSRGVMAPAASSETFRRHPWRTWPRAVRKPQEGRQPDVPTTARWVSLLVVGGSSRIPPELLSKGHWAIGRRESPLEKRTSPPFLSCQETGRHGIERKFLEQFPLDGPADRRPHGRAVVSAHQAGPCRPRRICSSSRRRGAQ